LGLNISLELVNWLHGGWRRYKTQWSS